MADALLSINDLAEQLQVPPGTCYRWNYLGTGPNFYKIGKHVRYKQSDVDAWVGERKAGTTQPAA